MWTLNLGMPAQESCFLLLVIRAATVVTTVCGVGEGYRRRSNPLSEQWLSCLKDQCVMEGTQVGGVGAGAGWAAHGSCSMGDIMCRSGIVSRCLPGTGSSCVWARAQQVWDSRRLVQDAHAAPHRPPSKPRVRPCAAAFHLTGSVLSGAQHFLRVTEFP